MTSADQPGVFVRIAQKSEHLKECFKSILKGNDVVVHPQIVQDIYNKELQIKLAPLNEVLQCVLLESLVYFINTWPGWTKYPKNRQFSETIFDTFKQHLIVQSKYVIRNEPFARSMSGECGSETHIVDGIVVFGPQSMLDLDIREKGNSLVIGKGPAVASEEKMTFRELINWPKSSISVLMGKLRIRRHIVLNEEQFLALSKNIPRDVERAEVRHKGPMVNHSRVLLNSVRELLTRLIGILRFVIGYNGTLTQILTMFLNEIEMIDIEGESNVHGHMYFLKRKQKYFRQKCIPGGAKVCLHEKFTPQIKYHFFGMETVLDDKERKEFLRKMKLLCKNDINSAVTQVLSFACDFCSYENASPDMLLRHYAVQHGREGGIKCSACLQSFSVAHLSRNCWEHNCSKVG